MLTNQTVNGITISYAYDVFGNVITQSVSDRTTACWYGPAGNLTLQINPDGGSVQYNYDKAGRLVKQSFGESVTKYDYDANGNVIEEVKNTAPASQKIYECDVMNNVTLKTI